MRDESYYSSYDTNNIEDEAPSRKGALFLFIIFIILLLTVGYFYYFKDNRFEFMSMENKDKDPVVDVEIKKEPRVSLKKEELEVIANVVVENMKKNIKEIEEPLPVKDKVVQEVAITPESNRSNMELKSLNRTLDELSQEIQDAMKDME